jgi:hypothetical protein
MNDLVATIVDGTHTRANVRAVIATLEDCNVRGVPVPQRLADAIPAVIAKLLSSDSPRVQAAGVKLSLAALKLNLEVHQHADKVARLDAGMATERHDVKLYGREAPVDEV